MSKCIVCDGEIDEEEATVCESCNKPAHPDCLELGKCEECSDEEEEE